MCKTVPFFGLQDISCLFFSQKQLGWNLGRSASRLCYTLKQYGILHKLSMAFEIHASNLTCIISEYFTPMLLTAGPQKSRVEYISKVEECLSLDLKHAWSQNSPI